MDNVAINELLVGLIELMVVFCNSWGVIGLILVAFLIIRRFTNAPPIEIKPTSIMFIKVKTPEIALSILSCSILIVGNWVIPFLLN